uniref:Uncharacterized AAA domain-containing protein ycf46 n=1 Tax=Titanophycus setchellii TaxID=940129 RepID=A0A1G4NYD5_9FLOR|nr:Hypothetical protein ycf46 [Titanophycus setchellii]SCW23526.1 Hypothetical protein ycf46 [Titanophycus setchellii]
MYFQTQLKLLIKSSCSFIYIVTYEEDRLESILSTITANDSSQALYVWDFIQGFKFSNSNYQNTKKNPLQTLDFIDSFNMDSDAIFLLKDFNIFFSDLAVARKMRNLSRKLDVCNHVIVISSTESSIGSEMKYLMQYLVMPLPNKYELRIELKRLFNILPSSPLSSKINTIADLSQGLSIKQLRNIIAKLMTSVSTVDDLYLQQFMHEKQAYISQTSILEVCHSTVSLDDIGGINNLKNWLLIRSDSFSQAAVNYGLPYPKGLLLLGIQGTGKSLTAKAIAHAWNLVLLRLDVGKLFAGIVGQSESNTREMIQVVEASAPCVLWIDEIDKVFDRKLSGNDSGTSNRVLATLLTWLADKTTPVFIVATANSIADLPAEIIRKGRFDEIFFLNLPSMIERKKIFQIHLQQVRPETWHRYNIDYLAKYTSLFSGAEIKQVIVEGMHIAFNQKRDFTSLDLLNAIETIVPLAFTDQDNVQKIQELAISGKFRLASSSST